ncbi:hypothetical protein C3486_32945 [Streptomyces sp. Ru73]|uniref:hypothetical protein n=1 Tax=Streptomyces sp. Ru73 TaxID=2080748 RepID=UPI000CDDD035|nr:hypothetical protein [Streptomyces sp. Ru73]POX36557.1 hypothetical protein C3486_32945 [Streptomyces sp. Ru73]
MRTRRLVSALALTALAGTATLFGPGSAGPAYADSSTPLPADHITDTVVDGVHQRVFMSAPNSDSVLVADYDGKLVGQIPGEQGASGLALSEDSGTLYVGLSKGEAIAAIDTGSLTETARYATGTGNQPSTPVVTGGKVWFSFYGSRGGGIGAVDLSGAEPVVTTDEVPAYAWYNAPLLAASPAAPGTLVAGEVGSSPATVAVYDVASGHPVEKAKVWNPGDGSSTTSNLRDMAVAADGENVVVASGAPYKQQVFKLSDLSPNGSYPTNPYPNAVAVAPDGTVAAGIDGYYEDDIYLFTPGAASAYRTYEVKGTANATLATRGLEWAPDGSRLFAITGAGTALQLKVLTEAAKADSQLTAEAPATAPSGPPLTVSGTLTAKLPYAGGTSVEVTRTGPAGGSAVPLGSATVAADGTFEVTDRPRGEGEVTYTVTYGGDARHTSATATATVQLTRR